MLDHTGSSAMASVMGPLLVVGLLVSGCASAAEREWAVADDPQASADEIIDAGHAVGMAIGKSQMVVTWEVQPEDDEGPYQGAWRLYDRDKGTVADGTFGTVREASARIDVVAVADGFLLTDYAKHRQHRLDVEGRLHPAQLDEAEPGTPLAGGVLLDRPGDAGWSVLLPDMKVVRLTDLPTRNVQGIELTSDGTVWVLLPWTSDGIYRVAYAKNGRGRWTTETIPLPKGSGTSGEGISAAGERLFVAAGREKGDRTTVDVILSRTAGATARWERIDASGIADNLTSYPRVSVARKGRLLASAGSEGAWIQKDIGSRFTELRPPGADRDPAPVIHAEGAWLWASQLNGRNELSYSYNYGETWREFER